MAEKSNGPKKKSKAPTARPAARPAVAKRPAKKAAPSKTAFYLSAVQPSVIISSQKPKDATAAQGFGSFDEARLAAIEVLVEAIELAEEQLLTLKRATAAEQSGNHRAG